MADLLTPTLRLHLQRLGAGPITVVFLHGLVMDNLSSWFFTAAPPTSAHARVLLYDLRGHGRSERPPTGYTLEDHLLDLDAVVAAEAQGPVVLVGNSFGGLLALAWAARHPDRTAGLVLVDGHLGGEGFAAQMVETLSLEGEARDQRIAESFSQWLGRHSARKRNRLAETAKALVHGTSLIADIRSDPPITDAELARIRAPALLLYGEASDLAPEARRLAATLPAAELHWLPGCTHSVLWEATEELKAAIVAFVVARAAGA